MFVVISMLFSLFFREACCRQYEMGYVDNILYHYDYWLISSRVILNPLTPRAFCQNFLFWKFFSLDVGQICMVFHDIFARACTEIKIWSFWSRKCPTGTSLGFFGCFTFWHLAFSPFLIIFAAVINRLLGLRPVQKFLT